MSEFAFADKREWPTSRLNERFVYLQEHLDNPLSPERISSIHTEMANLAFEGLQRQREANQKDKEVQVLEEAFTGQLMLPKE